MQVRHFYNALIAAILLTFVFAVYWEFHWRSQGFPIAYNDDKVIWADARKKISSNSDQTVLIGDSRVKFDIDLPTWKKITGEEPVQLALVGTAPWPVLKDLANDQHFHGRIIIGAAEPAFYSLDSTQRVKSAKDGLEYFYSETPAQNVNAKLDFLLESNFVFLEEGKFGLNALLNNLPIPNRKGVVVATGPPREFSSSTRDRQAQMNQIVFQDTAIRKVIQYWRISASRVKWVPLRGDSLQLFFHQIKSLIDRIRARGGKVVFIRPPSCGSVLERENKTFPKNDYWDLLLPSTQTSGLYYTDEPETANLVCPEESHLTPSDAALYTTVLIRFLKEKEGWNFKSYQPAASTINH